MGLLLFFSPLLWLSFGAKAESKDDCSRSPTDSSCAPTIDCRDYPETPRESNYCNYNHQQSSRCQIYCECHRASCENPPLPDDCSQFPRSDRNDRSCHNYPEGMASSGTCREYCHCNRQTCDNPPRLDCRQHPIDAAMSSFCSAVAASSNCESYCECHPAECQQEGPPSDCTHFFRTDYDDATCHENRSGRFCQSYCACNPQTCDNPPPPNCAEIPEEASRSNMCASPRHAEDFYCQRYCRCHSEACRNPPPPEDCSLFARNDVDDRGCHEDRDSYAEQSRGSCREYCACNPQGCQAPPQPPDCTLYPHEETGKDIACSAVPDFGDCPQYCTCNPGKCNTNGPPETPPSDDYCEHFPWDLACYCPGRTHLAECKAYCHLHAQRCDRRLLVRLPSNFPFFAFCEWYPNICYAEFSDQVNSLCRARRYPPICNVINESLPPRKILKKPRPKVKTFKKTPTLKK